MKMIIAHTSALKTNRFFSTLYPKDRFPPYLNLSVSFAGISTLRDFEWGFVDFHYSLFNGFREIKRVMISKEDISFKSFTHKINTGDLICKIRIGVYFSENQYQGACLVKMLNDIDEPEILDSLNFDQLKESILFGPTVGFLEKLRSMRTENFQYLLDKNLSALESLINDSSGRTFNLWTLSDTIIKLTSTSKLPLKYLDMAVGKYFEAYDEGKIRLGLTLNTDK
jgi:hypothetical protein